MCRLYVYNLDNGSKNRELLGPIACLRLTIFPYLSEKTDEHMKKFLVPTDFSGYFKECGQIRSTGCGRSSGCKDHSLQCVR